MDTTGTPSTASTFNLECPVSIQWTIAEEKLAALKDSTTIGCLATEKFNASNLPGIKYYLEICPNGNKEEHRGQVRIYLQLKLGNETRIKSDIKYTNESTGYSHKREDEYEKSHGWGFSICKTAELFDPAMKYIVDGKFALKCEGILIVQREKSAADENGINFDDGHIGHKLWKNDDKDFIIKVGENSIKVHKNVIASQSPVFKAMFHSGMKESTENSTDITDFSFKVVETAIQLCYLSETSNPLNLEDKMELLRFFDKYDMDSFKTSFQASLVKDVSISNVCQIANSSIISNAIKLKEKCAQLLIECINSKTPVAHIDILDKDFAFKLVTNACCNITQT